MLIKLMGKIREFSRRHNRLLTSIFKVSKIIVFITLIYTAGVMYSLGSMIISGVIGLLAILFLILNKLDSMS